MADDNKITDKIIGFDDLDTEPRTYVSDSEGYSPSTKQLIHFDEDGDLVLPRRLSQYPTLLFFIFHFLSIVGEVPN